MLSLDVSYVHCIEKGPHVRMKIIIGVNLDATQATYKLVPKSIAEYIDEDEKKVHEDKKSHQYIVQWS